MMLLDFLDICDGFRNPKFPLQSWAHLALVVFGLGYKNDMQAALILKNILPIGRDVNWFSFMLSLLKYLARENIPYGIRSHWLCSMFSDCAWMNWAGPKSMMLAI